MATTDMKDDEYSAAWNEDMPAAVEPSEDEAFGLAEPVEAKAEATAEAKEDGAAPETTSEDAGESSEGEAPAVALVIDGGEMADAVQEAGAKDSAEAAAEMGNDGETVAVAEEPAATVDVDKEVQRLKSWEGRLKAMEAKLKAAGADTKEEQTEAVAEAIEKAADTTDTVADEEKVEQIAEQVEDGQITPEQAMRQLAEDFGDDFVRMIEAIATAKAREAGVKAVDERVGEIKGTVDEIIADITDTKTRNHFEAIADKHPDFQEVGDSEEFKTYIESMPDDQKGQALEIIAGGSAKQIIKLLDGFKQANANGAKAGMEQPTELTEATESIVDEAVDESAMDAAEGVRSSGMKLPEQPGKADDYESAWNEF